MALLDNGMTWTHIASNTTATVRTGPCILHSVVINKAGASSNTATIYDNTGSATTNPVAVIDTTRASIGTLLYDVNMSNGLKIVTATGTSADITLCWTPVAG